MKKVVRMLGLCALVALAFTSCKKNETNSTLTFEASITQPQSNDRTWVTQRSNLAWSMGDTILMFDAANAASNYEFTVSNLEGIGGDLDQKATFVVEDAKKDFIGKMDTPKSYTAFYPNATFVDSTNKVSMAIPSEQYYDFENGHGGSFITETYPMIGVNDAAYHVQFHSHAGILQFNFGREEGRYVKVKQIIITANDPLVGTMVYDFNYPVNDFNGACDTAYTVNATSNRVVYYCSDNDNDGVELPEPAVAGGVTFIRFDIALLRGALASGFHITVVGDKNSPFNHNQMLFDEILMDEDVNAEVNTIEAEVITSMSNRLLPAIGAGEGDGFIH